MKYSVIASTFSGNKGAASMLEASIQTITDKDSSAEFTVFTVYPEEDKQFNTYKNVTILGAKPLYLALVMNPLALLYKLLPPFRALIKKNKHIKQLSESDVLLDQGGITFVDGRTKFLIYNIATILPAFFTNTRVVKCSQAMGPFTGINKFVSKIFLPRVDTICARGDITHGYLMGLGLDNIIESTDYAFLMDISDQQAKSAERIIKDHKISLTGKSNTIGILPSEVVRKKIEKSGQSYLDFNVEVINSLLAEGNQVVLMAYSARADKETLHNNDLIICREIASKINHKNFVFLDDEFSAQELRYIIGKMDTIITSRFHAMIAALSMVVPPIVVGWSHKYQEVMDMFGQKDLSLDSQKLDVAKLRDLTNKTVDNRRKISDEIKKSLPKVKESARKQVVAILND